MHERGDLTVLHEPFTYLYYLEHFPDSEDLQTFPNHFPKDANALFDWIEELAEDQPVFIKDMAFTTLASSERNLNRFKQDNWAVMVLFRHPAQSLPSLAHLEPDCDEEFLGYEGLWTFSELVPVRYTLDAADLLANPAAVYERFCTRFSLPYRLDALEFHKEPPPDWTGKWYETVLHSTQIEQKDREYPLDSEGVPLFTHIHKKYRTKWRKMYRRQLPFYLQLKDART